MADTKFGSFKDLLEITPEPLLPIVEELKAIILAIHPQAIEVVRLGDRAATYGVGPQKMKHGYCYIMPHKSWVNLGFFKGGILPDSKGLLEGTGKLLRHIKIRSIKDCKQAGLKKLIKVAVEERLSAIA